MAQINYLTVQDMMWLNLQLTKSTQKWDYARLEEGVFYQYGHGKSTDVVAQAGRFITGFVKMAPFAKGNEACAFAGLVAFLLMNGHDLHLSDSDALAWVRDVWEHPSDASAKIEVKLEAHDLHTHHGTPDTRGILHEVVARFPETLKTLVEEGRVATLI